jgi:hypothetical protein
MYLLNSDNKSEKYINQLIPLSFMKRATVYAQNIPELKVTELEQHIDNYLICSGGLNLNSVHTHESSWRQQTKPMLTTIVTYALPEVTAVLQVRREMDGYGHIRVDVASDQDQTGRKLIKPITDLSDILKTF